MPLVFESIYFSGRLVAGGRIQPNPTVYDHYVIRVEEEIATSGGNKTKSYRVFEWGVENTERDYVTVENGFYKWKSTLGALAVRMEISNITLEKFIAFSKAWAKKNDSHYATTTTLKRGYPYDCRGYAEDAVKWIEETSEKKG